MLDGESRCPHADLAAKQFPSPAGQVSLGVTSLISASLNSIE